MTATTYLQQKVLDHIGGNAAYPAPTAYLALFTSAPNDAGGGTEVSGGSYARVDVSGSFDNAAGVVMNSNATVTFPRATGDWGTVTHGALYDAPTGGNMLMYGALNTARLVESGDVLSFVPTGIVPMMD